MTSPAAAIATASRDWQPSYPVDVRRTLSVLQHGRGDPCHRVTADGSVWRTSRMPTGAVSYRVRQTDPHHITADAWGDGADELIESLPELLGSRDCPETFVPGHPLLHDAHRRLVGLRVPATGRVLESLIPAVLEQKVIGLDAAAAWRRLVTTYGDHAPGPVPDGMRLAPDAAGWLAVPSWGWHTAGVDGRRVQAARTGASYAAKLERVAAASKADPAEVYRLLTALPGIGVWTAAQVGHRALGDADALPLGDYHLASGVGWALTGAPLDEDPATVLEFFEAWRPHRFRVVRLLELIGAGAPRRGPRLTRQDYRRI